MATTGGDLLGLVGVWPQGRRFEPEEEFVPRIPIIFDVYKLKGKVGQMKPRGTFEIDEILKADDLDVVREIEWRNLAVSGANRWKAVTMKRLPTNNQDYEKMVGEFLRQNKARTKKVRISELFVQDINGDGNREALLVANSHFEPPEEPETRPHYGMVLCGKTGANANRLILEVIIESLPQREWWAVQDLNL